MTREDQMRAALPALAAGSINDLWTEPCCTTCCAPCGALRDLLDADLLDDAVRPYVARTGEWDWWIGSAESGRVDADGLRSRWGCQSSPRCEGSAS